MDRFEIQKELNGLIDGLISLGFNYESVYIDVMSNTIHVRELTEDDNFKFFRTTIELYSYLKKEVRENILPSYLRQKYWNPTDKNTYYSMGNSSVYPKIKTKIVVDELENVLLI